MTARSAPVAAARRWLLFLVAVVAPALLAAAALDAPLCRWLRSSQASFITLGEPPPPLFRAHRP